MIGNKQTVTSNYNCNYKCDIKFDNCNYKWHQITNVITSVTFKEVFKLFQFVCQEKTKQKKVESSE